MSFVNSKDFFEHFSFRLRFTWNHTGCSNEEKAEALAWSNLNFPHMISDLILTGTKRTSAFI